MTEEEAFLQALKSNPEDVSAWLVYADWLDERGDPRGEYLRLEVRAEQDRLRWQALRERCAPRWLEAVSRRALRYNSHYGLHSDVSLQSGRSITLKSLQQGQTYDGLLEGTPNKGMNDDGVLSAMQEAQRVSRTPTHLLPPPRRDYHQRPGDMGDNSERGRRHPPEWLPLVRCIGIFECTRPVRNPRMDGSALTVVWFQDDYALPILEPALTQLRELDWAALAGDLMVD